MSIFEDKSILSLWSMFQQIESKGAAVETILSEINSEEQRFKVVFKSYHRSCIAYRLQCGVVDMMTCVGKLYEWTKISLSPDEPSFHRLSELQKKTMRESHAYNNLVGPQMAFELVMAVETLKIECQRYIIVSKWYGSAVAINHAVANIKVKMANIHIMIIKALVNVRPELSQALNGFEFPELDRHTGDIKTPSAASISTNAIHSKMTWPEDIVFDSAYMKQNDVDDAAGLSSDYRALTWNQDIETLQQNDQLTVMKHDVALSDSAVGSSRGSCATADVSSGISDQARPSVVECVEASPKLLKKRLCRKFKKAVSVIKLSVFGWSFNSH